MWGDYSTNVIDYDYLPQACFVNLEKANEKVSREKLCGVLRENGAGRPEQRWSSKKVEGDGIL